MAIRKELVTRFINDGNEHGRPYRSVLIGSIDRASFSIEYLYDKGPVRAEVGGQSFGVFIKPNTNARKKYGIDREVLVWCSTFPTFSARDTNKIRDIRSEHGTRLSSMFTILVTKYNRTDRSNLEVESAESETIVHLTFDDLRDRTLDSLLDERLYSRDPFDLTGAVVRSADFFGRREQIDRLAVDIETGVSQIGIFGLRKAGKTSLLNRLHDKLQNSARVYVARIDLQWTTSINSAPEFTAWAIGESIVASHKEIRRIEGFRLFGKYSTFSDISNVAPFWEWLANDLRRLMDQSKRPVCILIDEIERMFEGSETGFLRYWRVLRGLDQQTPGRLRFVVGGTSPQCTEEGYIRDEDNPMFQYLKVHYLGPLTLEDSGDMLTSLGQLGGIEFTEAALLLAYESTGGHPALLRALGSAIHSGRKGQVSAVTVSPCDIRNSNDLIQQYSGSLIDQMLSSLHSQYPDERSLLDDLAFGRVQQFRDYAQSFPEAYRRLVNYGLVTDTEPPMVRIGQLQTRVQRISQRTSPRSGRYSLSPGERLGDWQIIDAIAFGGLAEIYRVASPDGHEAAAKVFTYSSAASVSREVDILKELSHPNIVEFYEVVASEDGKPGLVMEMLPGRLLADYCNPDFRPSEKDWYSWLIKILDALVMLHPKVRTPQPTELSYAEFQKWQSDKFGYIHRDIKPENIIVVEERGPVLIDFNISSKSGDPVMTTSSTPGYMPFLSSVWTPQTDRYALGVTFAELAVGSRVRDSSLEDLISSMRGIRSPSMCRIVEYLTDSSDRVVPTEDILKEVRALRAGKAA